jgi:hypothetical protein
MRIVGVLEPAAIRGRARGIRERARWNDLRGDERVGRLLRALLLSSILALLLSLSGAFGTDDIQPALRLVLLQFVFLTGASLQVGVGEMFDRWCRAPATFRAAATAVAAFSILTLLCWGLAAALQEASAPPIQEFLAPVAIVMAASAALIRLFPGPAGRRPSHSARESVFQERLPTHLRTAVIHAVKAEDHYLRVFTSRGDCLVLLSLARALDELNGDAGHRTHRSWWVARDAVDQVRRGHGRAVLTLVNGVTAPVSRTYSGHLRKSGWY